MKEQTKKLAELIYELANGLVGETEYKLPAGLHVTNEFQEGMPCDNLYKEVFDAKIRLNQRLQVKDDKDVDTIIDALEGIGHHMSVQMFLYGLEIGNLLTEEK